MIYIVIIWYCIVVQVSAKSIKISEKSFPEEYFCYYISFKYDLNGDGWLSDDERKKVKEIDVGEYSEYRAGYEYPVVHTLKGIEYFPNLEVLTCSGNALKKLDVTKNKKLKKLYCSRNALHKLNIKENKKLKIIGCARNEIKKLDLRQNREVECVYCYDNKIRSIDVSKNRKLKELEISENKLRKLDVTMLRRLEILTCAENKLSELNVSKNKRLDFLACNSNRIEKLNLKKNKSLTTLYCYDNKLLGLDLSNNHMLEYLFCYKNQMVTGNVKLPYSQFEKEETNPQKQTICVKKIGKHYYIPLKGVNRTNVITNLSAGKITDKGIWLTGKKIPKKITYEYNMFTDGENMTKVEIKVKKMVTRKRKRKGDSK